MGEQRAFQNGRVWPALCSGLSLAHHDHCVCCRFVGQSFRLPLRLPGHDWNDAMVIIESLTGRRALQARAELRTSGLSGLAAAVRPALRLSGGPQPRPEALMPRAPAGAANSAGPSQSPHVPRPSCSHRGQSWHVAVSAG